MNGQLNVNVFACDSGMDMTMLHNDVTQAHSKQELGVRFLSLSLTLSLSSSSSSSSAAAAVSFFVLVCRFYPKDQQTTTHTHTYTNGMKNKKHPFFLFYVLPLFIFT